MRYTPFNIYCSKKTNLCDVTVHTLTDKSECWAGSSYICHSINLKTEPRSASETLMCISRIIRSHIQKSALFTFTPVGNCISRITLVLTSWLHEAETLLTSQQPLSFSRILRNILCYPKAHYHVHKCPSLAPVLNQLFLLRSILILPSNLRLGLPAVPFLLACPLKCYVHSSSHQCVLHALMIPFFLT